MSFILKKDINDGDGYLFFKGWAGKNSKHPEFCDKLHFARHWADRTNCKRFLTRNKGVLLHKHKFYIERVIEDRHCDYCGGDIDQYARTDAKYCSDDCRRKAFGEEKG